MIADRNHMRLRMKVTAAVALIAVVLAGCGNNDRPSDQRERTVPATQESTNEPVEQPAEEADGSLQVSRSDYGDAWPLTVESGTLTCEPPGAVTFTDPDGKVWGVNGLAIGQGNDRIDPIWAESLEGPAPKVDIGPLIDDGLALCDEE